MKTPKQWTFITNHGLILLFISQHQQCTAREMAFTIRATERTVHRVLIDLEKGGYISRVRTGRANIYRINWGHGVKHGRVRDLVIGDLINILETSEIDNSHC